MDCNEYTNNNYIQLETVSFYASQVGMIFFTHSCALFLGNYYDTPRVLSSVHQKKNIPSQSQTAVLNLQTEQHDDRCDRNELNVLCYARCLKTVGLHPPIKVVNVTRYRLCSVLV